MAKELLHKLVDAIPIGRWGVGVSGGADSVALLLLLQARSDLQLHAIHLDHETRNGESARDADFVRQLCGELKVDCTIQTRSNIETCLADKSNNLPGRYRQARFELFRQVVSQHDLAGVVLAHHANDQAETVLMRLLRGSAAAHLGGIRGQSRIDELIVLHPLLEASSNMLREYLHARGQTWREDASNASPDYRRNELRLWLVKHPQMTESLLKLGQASDAVNRWLEETAPGLGKKFATSVLADLPSPIARQAAAAWLLQRGCPVNELSAQVCDRLVVMCGDLASPSGQHFPGRVLVRRRSGMVFADRASPTDGGDSS